MIPRYCLKARKCSYGREHNPCNLYENCPAFLCDTRKTVNALNAKKDNSEQLQEKKPSKYRNEKVEYDGIIFDSKLEMKRYCELKVLEKANKIKELRRQVKFVLIDKTENYRETSYIADFTYQENGKLVVEDCKSKITKTQVYKIKKKLMQERYGITIKEVEK